MLIQQVGNIPIGCESTASKVHLTSKIFLPRARVVPQFHSGWVYDLTPSGMTVPRQATWGRQIVLAAYTSRPANSSGNIKHHTDPCRDRFGFRVNELDAET